MNLMNLLQRPPEVRLLSLHLPKTAGSSINIALRELYFDVFRPHRRSDLKVSAEASKKTEGLFGLSDEQIRDIALHYGLLSNPRDTRVVMGHFRFTAKIIEQLSSQWRVAAVLREPTSRWLSEYYYNRFKKSDHYKTDLELDEYLESRSGKLGGQCYAIRFLSEAPFDIGCDITSSMLADAKKNITRVNVLGLLEEFDDFIKRLNDTLGRTLYVGHHNSNPAPKPANRQSLDKATLCRIESLCEPDLELYQHARHLLGKH